MKLLKKIFIKTQQFEVSLLYLCLAVSLATFTIYLLDLSFNDKFLFFLLNILRYSSFVLCICSLYKLLVNIYHTVRRPSLLRVIKSLLYLLFIAYGLFVILLETLISVVSGGTGN